MDYILINNLAVKVKDTDEVLSTSEYINILNYYDGQVYYHGYYKDYQINDNIYENLFIHTLVLYELDIHIINKFRGVKYIVLKSENRQNLDELVGNYKIHINNNIHQYDDPRICGISHHKKVHMYPNLTKVKLLSRQLHNCDLTNIEKLVLFLKPDSDPTHLLKQYYKSIDITIVNHLNQTSDSYNMLNLINNINAKNISLTCYFISTEHIKILLDKPNIKSLHLQLKINPASPTKFNLENNYTLLYFTRSFSLNNMPLHIYERNLELYQIRKMKPVKSARKVAN